MQTWNGTECNITLNRPNSIYLPEAVPLAEPILQAFGKTRQDIGGHDTQRKDEARPLNFQLSQKKTPAMQNEGGVPSAGKWTDRLSSRSESHIYVGKEAGLEWNSGLC